VAADEIFSLTPKGSDEKQFSVNAAYVPGVSQSRTKYVDGVFT